MGGFQNFAISFTIISVLAGCLTSYFVAFERGGPVAVTYGWLLVGLFSTIIALAMAEIASAFPTAGGLYYWASKLGGPGWGWTTGWFNLIGQIAVTAAIGYGLATFGTVLFDFWFSYSEHMNDWFGFSANTSIFVLYAAFLLAAGLLNMFQVSLTAMLNSVSAYWHMAEETQKASRMAAVGMYMAVVVSVVVGWILLLAVTFAIPSTEGALENIGVVVPWIWSESMSQGWAEALLFICVVAQFFCVTASVTSASRMMYAFSRDRAVPGHPLWSKVASNRVPRNAVWAIVALAALLMVPAIWNYLVGYGVGTAIAVIGLYIAFVIPVYLRYRLHDRFEPGAWSLGRHYKWIDLLSLAWVALITILFVFPLYRAGLPWEDDFSWGAHELHGAVVRRDRARLRRLVVPLGQELVQGPCPSGHRGGARTDRGGTRRIGPPPRTRGVERHLIRGGAPRGAPPRAQDMSGATGVAGAGRLPTTNNTAAAATSASAPAARNATVYSPVAVRTRPAPQAAVAAPSWWAEKIQAKTMPAWAGNAAVVSAEVGGTVATQSSP